MAVYYKWTTYVLMFVCAVSAGLFFLFYYHGEILVGQEYGRIFFMGLFIILGGVLGRVLAMILASRRLREIDALLFRDTKPEEYIRVFGPMNEKIPHELSEYVNGVQKLSFAYEAIGKFEEAERLVNSVEPEKLRMHALPTTALIVNQRCNLALLRKDAEKAEGYIKDMGSLKEAAEHRARMLAQNLGICIRLSEARRNALLASDETDTAFLSEEIELSTNLIHRKEMELEMASFFLRRGEKEKAEPLLESILKDRKGLWTEEEAERMLDNPNT